MMGDAPNEKGVKNENYRKRVLTLIRTSLQLIKYYIEKNFSL
jgi:hypothetical protein